MTDVYAPWLQFIVLWTVVSIFKGIQAITCANGKSKVCILKINEFSLQLYILKHLDTSEQQLRVDGKNPISICNVVNHVLSN